MCRDCMYCTAGETANSPAVVADRAVSEAASSAALVVACDATSAAYAEYHAACTDLRSACANPMTALTTNDDITNPNIRADYRADYTGASAAFEYANGFVAATHIIANENCDAVQTALLAAQANLNAECVATNAAHHRCSDAAADVRAAYAAAETALSVAAQAVKVATAEIDFAFACPTDNGVAADRAVCTDAHATFEAADATLASAIADAHAAQDATKEANAAQDARKRAALASPDITCDSEDGLPF